MFVNQDITAKTFYYLPEEGKFMKEKPNVLEHSTIYVSVNWSQIPVSLVITSSNTYHPTVSTERYTHNHNGEFCYSKNGIWTSEIPREAAHFYNNALTYYRLTLKSRLSKVLTDLYESELSAVVHDFPKSQENTEPGPKARKLLTNWQREGRF